MDVDPRTGPRDRRRLITRDGGRRHTDPTKKGVPVKIPLDASYFSDELTVRFYTCPTCGFDHVPFGASAWTDEPEERTPEHDARYCPGCASPIEWTA